MKRLAKIATIALAAGVLPASAKADLATGSVRVGITIYTPGAPAPAAIAVRNARFTPVAAASVLAGKGFSNMSLVRRSASAYVFSATSGQDGKAYLVTVSVWQGQVLNITKA